MSTSLNYVDDRIEYDKLYSALIKPLPKFQTIHIATENQKMFIFKIRRKNGIFYTILYQQKYVFTFSIHPTKGAQSKLIHIHLGAPLFKENIKWTLDKYTLENINKIIKETQLKGKQGKIIDSNLYYKHLVINLDIGKEGKNRFTLNIFLDGDNHQNTNLSDEYIKKIQTAGNEVLAVVGKIIIEDINRVFNESMLNYKGKRALTTTRETKKIMEKAEERDEEGFTGVTGRTRQRLARKQAARVARAAEAEAKAAEAAAAKAKAKAAEAAAKAKAAEAAAAKAKEATKSKKKKKKKNNNNDIR